MENNGFKVDLTVLYLHLWWSCFFQFCIFVLLLKPNFAASAGFIYSWHFFLFCVKCWQFVRASPWPIYFWAPSYLLNISHYFSVTFLFNPLQRLLFATWGGFFILQYSNNNVAALWRKSLSITVKKSMYIEECHCGKTFLLIEPLPMKSLLLWSLTEVSFCLCSRLERVMIPRC